jgi:methylphosphotriester-DNA--protein-cysteine methyltransferase
MDTTPHEYLTQARLKQAMHLLSANTTVPGTTSRPVRIQQRNTFHQKFQAAPEHDTRSVSAIEVLNLYA